VESKQQPDKPSPGVCLVPCMDTKVLADAMAFTQKQALHYQLQRRRHQRSHNGLRNLCRVKRGIGGFWPCWMPGTELGSRNRGLAGLDSENILAGAPTGRCGTRPYPEGHHAWDVHPNARLAAFTPHSECPTNCVPKSRRSCQ
jgi:hypothetical protein